MKKEQVGLRWGLSNGTVMGLGWLLDVSMGY